MNLNFEKDKSIFKIEDNFNTTNQNSKNEEKILNLKKKNEEKKYRPTILITLTTYFLFMFGLDIYFGVLLFTILAIIVFGILWLYSFVSIIKNDFKKDNQKIVWIIVIIFVPISAIIYPDFRRTQTVND